VNWMHKSTRTVDAAQIFEVISGFTHVPIASIWMLGVFGHCYIPNRFSWACTAKTHTGNTGEVTNASSTSRSGLPPRSRHYCRPILKGAPFIVCSNCFKLLQAPIDFAVSTNAVSKLQCGSCSSVLTYSYREPARKKPYQDSVDQLSTDSSKLQVDAALRFNNLIGGVTCCESYSKISI